VIVETPDSEPFKWLQSLDDPALAFVIVNPLVFFADYRIDVDRRELEELKITDPASVITHVIVSIPDGDMSGMSANLQGPILINMENNLAKQLVLVNGPYTIRHPLLKQVTEKPAGEPHGAKTETNAG
jgi:flagellar assembly factor FliW